MLGTNILGNNIHYLLSRFIKRANLFDDVLISNLTYNKKKVESLARAELFRIRQHSFSQRPLIQFQSQNEETPLSVISMQYEVI